MKKSEKMYIIIFLLNFLFAGLNIISLVLFVDYNWWYLTTVSMNSFIAGIALGSLSYIIKIGKQAEEIQKAQEEYKKEMEQIKLDIEKIIEDGWETNVNF